MPRLTKPPASLALFLLHFLLISCISDRSYLSVEDNHIITLKPEYSQNAVSYRLKKPLSLNTLKPDSEQVYFRAEVSVPASGFILIIETESAVEIPVYYSEGSSAIIDFALNSRLSITGCALKNSIKDSDIKISGNNTGIKSIYRIEKHQYFYGFKRESSFIHYSQSIYPGWGSTFFYLNIDISGLKSEKSTFNYSLAVGSKDNGNQDISEKIHINLITQYDDSQSAVKSLTAEAVKNRITLFPADMELTAGISVIQILFPGIYRDSLSSCIIPADIIEAGFTFLAQNSNSSLASLPADLGTIISRDRNLWRYSSFELYSWSLFPEILVIDTIDNAFQNSMFKRLVHYTEKPHTNGKLLTNSEMRNLKSWNAHDYSAADLASFFSDAALQRFRLNPEEDLLKAILVENRIIIKEDGIFKPAGGGILSISQASALHLRALLLNHEGYHGIYYASENFRNKCIEIWNMSDDDIRIFWKLFLNNKTYDGDNVNLLVKEFKGYSLQQPVEMAERYFFNMAIPSLSRYYPGYSYLFERLKTELRADFLENCKKLENALFEETGLKAGNLFLVRRDNS